MNGLESFDWCVGNSRGSFPVRVKEYPPVTTRCGFSLTGGCLFVGGPSRFGDTEMDSKSLTAFAASISAESIGGDLTKRVRLGELF